MLLWIAQPLDQRRKGSRAGVHMRRLLLLRRRRRPGGLPGCGGLLLLLLLHGR